MFGKSVDYMCVDLFLDLLFFSIDLYHFFLLMLYCLDHSHFIINLKNQIVYILLIYPFKIPSTTLGLLLSYIHFRMSLPIKKKKSLLDFDWKWTESIDQLGENGHLYYIVLQSLNMIETGFKIIGHSYFLHYKDD